MKTSDIMINVFLNERDFVEAQIHKNSKAMRVCILIFIVIAILSCAINLKDTYWIKLICASISIAMFIYIAINRICLDYEIKNTFDNNKLEIRSATYLFTNKMIIKTIDEENKLSVNYKDITAIKETENEMILQFRNTMFVLPKRFLDVEKMVELRSCIKSHISKEKLSKSFLRKCS